MSTKSARLKAARLARRITLERAARDLHVAVSTYKGWEAGTEPRSLDTASRVCTYLGISLDYYVNGTEHTPPITTPQQDRMMSICDQWPDDVLDQVLDTMELITSMIARSSSAESDSD